MIRNVIFDLGGVLINDNPLACMRRLGFGDDRAVPMSRALAGDPYWAEMDLGLYDSLDGCVETLISHQPKEFEADLRRFFSGQWMAGMYTPLTENLPLYHKLRGEGYGIYLLSNFFTEGFAMLDRLYDFIRDADGRIVSSHVHLRKPQPEIYQALLDRYSLKPEECIFFDDRQVNADAAAAQGIRAVRFLNVRQAEEDFRCFSRFN